MTVNCICTACESVIEHTHKHLQYRSCPSTDCFIIFTFPTAYSLFMRYATKNINLPRMGMIFYNNLLSILFLLPVIIMRNEIPSLFDPQIMTKEFFITNTIAGILGKHT